MKKYLLTFILLNTFILAVMSQEYGDTLYVMAYNGINIRSAPNTASEKIDAIPFGTPIMYCSDDDSDRFEARNGKWVEIEYNYESCYVFDGFLSQYPTPKSRNLNIDEIGDYIIKTYGGEVENIVFSGPSTNGDKSEKTITNYKSGLIYTIREYPATTYKTYAFTNLRTRDLINIIDLAYSNYNKDNKTLISHFEEDDFWKNYDPNDICPGAFPVKITDKISIQYENIRKSMAIEPIPKIVISKSKY